jgi:hypothetical protein
MPEPSGYDLIPDALNKLAVFISNLIGDAFRQ